MTDALVCDVTAELELEYSPLWKGKSNEFLNVNGYRYVASMLMLRWISLCRTSRCKVILRENEKERNVFAVLKG